MAKANPVKLGEATPVDKPAKPVIEYYGEGARDVKFEIDPKAVLIKVYGDGRIVMDY